MIFSFTPFAGGLSTILRRTAQQVVAILCLLLFFSGKVVAQQTLYAVSGSSGVASTLYKIDPATGAIVATVGATGYNHITAMAIHPTTGVMYGYVNSSPPHTTFTGFLVTINQTTGVATQVGTSVSPFHGSDMTFSPSGTLYIWAEPGQDDLYTLDLTTGAATLVGNCACGTARTGLAFTPSGTLYMKSATTIHQMNPATGAIQTTVDYSAILQNMLASDQNNVLYSGERGSGGIGFTLRTINPTTGAVATVGSNALNNIAALAFLPCTMPTFTACPGNLTASTTTTSCNAVVSYTATASGFPAPTYTYSFSGATIGSGSGTGSGSTFNRGVTTVTITAANSCGSAVCSFTVTVTDNTPPTISCPANITVNAAPGTCGAVVNYQTPTASDNCFCSAGASISGYTYMGTFGGHYYYRSNATTSWTSANSAAVGLGGYLATIGSAAENAFVSSNVPSYGWLGLTDQATEGIFVWANGEPFVYANFCNAEPNNNGNEDYIVINWCPVGLDGPAAGKGWNDLADFNSTFQAVAVVEFDCIPVTVIRTAGPASGSTFPVGTTTVTYKATDGTGNSASCSFTVTVIDNELPKITCPANITVNNDPGQCGAKVTYSEPTVTDNCSMCDVTSVSGYAYLGKYNGHSYFISNNTGQWAAFNTAAESLGAHLATVTSAGEHTFLTSQTPSTAWIGLTDQTTEGTFVWVTGEPLIYTNWCAGEPNNGPGGNEDWVIMNSCGGGGWNDGSNNTCCPHRAIIEFECGSNRTSGPASGGFFPVGTTTVSYSAADAAGNPASCSFTVTVNDTEPPKITCPADVTKACDDNSSTGQPVVSDNCGGVGIVFNDAVAQGNCAGNYVITRTWRATDLHNNSSTCVQTITVQDNVAPTITCPADVTIACTASTGTAANGMATATDNCSGATVTSADVITQGSCAGNYVIARKWTATDGCGNSSSCTQTITVQDLTAPTITCPPDMTIACTADNTPAGTGTATAVDDCSGVTPATFVDNKINGSCAGNYIIERTWTIKDGCGNASTCKQIITVQDKTGPTAICKNVMVTLSNGSATVTAAQINNGSTDNCSGIASMNLSKTSFNCSNIGSNPVTLTLTDGCGNSSTCTATVTVVGAIPSCTITTSVTDNTYTGGVTNNIYLGYGPQSVNILVNPSGGSGFTYSWSGSNLAYLSCNNCANPVFTPLAAGNYTFTVTVTNSNGCSTTCIVKFCVIDARDPQHSQKVIICHIPPGNPSNTNTNSVGASAVAAHLAHGDRLGPCNQVCGSTARYVSGNNSVIGDEVKVYPNPNNGSFVVEIPYTGAEKAQITVSDLQGKLIQRRAVSENEGQKIMLNLGDVARGVYFIEVTYGGQRFRTKLQVQ